MCGLYELYERLNLEISFQDFVNQRLYVRKDLRQKYIQEGKLR